MGLTKALLSNVSGAAVGTSQGTYTFNKDLSNGTGLYESGYTYYATTLTFTRKVGSGASVKVLDGIYISSSYLLGYPPDGSKWKVSDFTTKVTSGPTVTDDEITAARGDSSITTEVLLAKYVDGKTVTLNNRDGTTYDTLLIAPGNSASLPTLDDEEYLTFAGWEDGSGNVHIGTYADVQDDITLTAKYTGDPVTVTLDANGGTVSPDTVTVEYTGKYSGLPTPTMENYLFTGWYTARSGGTEVDETTTVTDTSDHTLYARWIPAFSVTFEGSEDGGVVRKVWISVNADVDCAIRFGFQGGNVAEGDGDVDNAFRLTAGKGYIFRCEECRKGLIGVKMYAFDGRLPIPG